MYVEKRRWKRRPHFIFLLDCVESEGRKRKSQARLEMIEDARVNGSKSAGRAVMNQWPQNGEGLLHLNVYQVENEKRGKVWDILPCSRTFHSTKVTQKLRLRKTLVTQRLAECGNSSECQLKYPAVTCGLAKTVLLWTNGLGRRHYRKKCLTFRLAPGSYGSENRLTVKEKGLYWKREKHGDSTCPKSHCHSPWQRNESFLDSLSLQM